jgi:CheY-like chemotaxis protein
VRAYESGAAVLAEFEYHCDCLITDYHMPGMNGVELIRTLRRSHLLVCMVLTGSDGGSIEGGAREAGAVAVLRKPMDPRLLLKLLEAVSGARAIPPKFDPSTADDHSVTTVTAGIG